MSFFKNLFGKKKQEHRHRSPAPAAPLGTPIPRRPPNLPPIDPATDKNLIKVFDAYGREMFITRQQWRDSILLGNIEKAWDKPDDLFQLVFSALNDGFRSDVVDAAEQLYKIDPQHERGTCVWGIVLNEEGRCDEAEKVFRNHIAKHGESGVILTNLAKVYAKRGDNAEAEKILWHGLELDPNQDNGLAWYYAIHKERGGDTAVHDALQRIARLPGSWRAQLWLAREELQKRNLAGALDFYREALARLNPAPADALMQISGDLGNTGHLPELLELITPHFNPELHGIQVGNNLIKARVDLGQVDAARTILNQLYALKRPDWKQPLAFWDTEIAKIRVQTTAPLKQEELSAAMLAFNGPIWLKPTSAAAELFPGKEPDSVRIVFLGSSADSPTNPEKAELQLADTKGRLSRSIPLFLAEQVEFGSNALVQTLIPWITNAHGSFVLAGSPWSDEQAASSARQGEIKNDYIICSHLKTGNEPWVLQARLIRTIDGTCVGTAEAPIFSNQPEEGLHRIMQQLAPLLTQEAGLDLLPLPVDYQIPSKNDFSFYLLRLEQLLSIRCDAMEVEKGHESFLSGEREILDGNLQQCIAYPLSFPARILMAQTFWTMRLVRPDILAEFKDRVDMLQREHPLPEPAQSVVQRILNESFGG